MLCNLKHWTIEKKKLQLLISVSFILTDTKHGSITKRWQRIESHKSSLMPDPNMDIHTTIFHNVCWSRQIHLTCCAAWWVQWLDLTVIPSLWSIAPGRSVGFSTSLPSAQHSASPLIYPEPHKTDRGSLSACVIVRGSVRQEETSTQRIGVTPFNKCTRIPIHTLARSFALFSHSHTHTYTTHTHGAACTIAFLFLAECSRKELWITFSRSPQCASHSAVTQSWNSVPWNMYKLALTLFLTSDQ